MTSSGADSTSFTSVSLPERFDFAFPRADPPPLAVWERRQEQIHPLLQTHPRGSRGRTRERRGGGVWSGRGAEGKAVPRTVDWKGVDPVRRGLKGGSPGFEPGFDRVEKEHDTLASVEPRPSRKDAPFSRSFSLPTSPEDRGVDRPSACQGGLWGIEGPSRSPSPRRCESEGHVRIVRGGREEEPQTGSIPSQNVREKGKGGWTRFETKEKKGWGGGRDATWIHVPGKVRRERESGSPCKGMSKEHWSSCITKSAFIKDWIAEVVMLGQMTTMLPYLAPRGNGASSCPSHPNPLPNRR